MIELDAPVVSASDVQFAVDTAESWVGSDSAPPMLGCGTSSSFECEASADLMTFTYSSSFTSANIKYAVNVVGRFVQPPGDWLNNPYEYTCGDPVPTEPPSTGEPSTDDPPASVPPVDPSDCVAPEIPPCPNRLEQWPHFRLVLDEFIIFIIFL